jgi:hypothetical protein
MIRPLAFLLLGLAALRAQDPIPDAVTCAGTSALDPAGRPWGYVVLNARNPATLNGRALAVFIKPGPPESPASFANAGILTPQSDPTVLRTFLQRSACLGEDRPLLEGVTAELFRLKRWEDAGKPPYSPANAHLHGPASPVPALADRLGALLQRASSDADMAQSLLLMGRGRPTIKQALGQAWAGPLPVAPGNTETTIEIRDWDVAGNRSLSVVGRVSLVASLPAPLPAPGPPVQIPELNAKGDLNIKLRWGTTTELARRILLTSGFDVWRLPASDAASLPPNPSLADLSAANATKVNNLPVAPPKSFTTGNPAAITDAANTAADASTYFFADDNRRFQGGTPFDDGQRFIYFITPLDLLGRPGTPSPAGTAEACRRIPPDVPKGLKIRNLYEFTAAATREQRFEISWSPNTNRAEPAPDPATGNLLPRDITSHYEIFRGSDLEDLHDPARHSNLSLVSQFPHDSPLPDGTTDHSIIDTSLPVLAPQLGEAPPAPGTTAPRDSFFYVIRAVRLDPEDPLKCRIASAFSAPVFATLHELEGPDAPTVDLSINCARALVGYENRAVLPQNPPVPARHWSVRCIVRRMDAAIAWARFKLEILNPDGSTAATHDLDEHWFSSDDQEVEQDFVFEHPAQPRVRWSVQVGGYSGSRSRWSQGFTDTDFANDSLLVHRFRAAELSPVSFQPEHPLAPQMTVGNTVTSVPVTWERKEDGLLLWNLNLPTGVEILIQREVSPGAWRFTDVVKGDNGPIYFTDGLSAGGSPNATRRAFVLRPPQLPDEICVPLMTATDGGGAIAPIVIKGKLPLKGREFRIYRQLENGSLSMISQGTGDECTHFAFHDGVASGTCARRSYFVQALDKNGNPSALVQAGKDVSPAVKAPRPRISQLKPAGDDTNPAMLIEWFCPPSGIERFELLINSAVPLSIPSQIRISTLAKPAVVKPKGTGTGGPKLRFTETFRTPTVGGPDFNDIIQSENGRFRMEWPVKPGTSYTVSLRAVSCGTSAGDPSTEESFTWSLPVTIIDEPIPWPARPLPPVRNAWHPAIAAVLLPTTTGPGIPAVRRGGYQSPESPDDVVAAVRIGSQLGKPGDIEPDHGYWRYQPIASSPGNGKPSFENFIPRDAQAPTSTGPLPVVLYRRQLFPDGALGDVIQVSPLIQSVAQSRGQNFSRLLDPYLLVVDHTAIVSDFPQPLDLCILDTQPSLAGATYRYLLARFDAVSGEIIDVVRAGDITIPIR